MPKASQQKRPGRGRPKGSRPIERPITPDRLYYRPKEVAKALGIGVTTVYDGIYRGTIPSRKVGDALLVPASFVRGENERDAR